jgi:hypothetical protein
MNESKNRHEKPQRAFVVDMSSEAITSRLREVGELCQLGTSLARAKPCAAPSQSMITFSTKETEAFDVGKLS